MLYATTNHFFLVFVFDGGVLSKSTAKIICTGKKNYVPWKMTINQTVIWCYLPSSCDFLGKLGLVSYINIVSLTMKDNVNTINSGYNNYYYYYVILAFSNFFFSKLSFMYSGFCWWGYYHNKLHINCTVQFCVFHSQSLLSDEYWLESRSSLCPTTQTNKSTKVLMPRWCWPNIDHTAYMTAATHIHARTAQLQLLCTQAEQ